MGPTTTEAAGTRMPSLATGAEGAFTADITGFLALTTTPLLAAAEPGVRIVLSSAALKTKGRQAPRPRKMMLNAAVRRHPPPSGL